jgi:hypothetical protein
MHQQSEHHMLLPVVTPIASEGAARPARVTRTQQ